MAKSELLYESETALLRQGLFKVQNEVGLGRREEAYQKAFGMWLQAAEIPHVSKPPYCLQIADFHAHTLIPDFVDASLRHKGLAVTCSPEATSCYSGMTIDVWPVECLLIQETFLLVHTALFDNNEFNISRGLSFMKSIGIRWGIAVNFGKTHVEITALRV